MSEPLPGPAPSSLTEDYEDLYHNAPCGYLSLNPSGHIVKANRTIGNWLGLSPAELTTKRFTDLLSIAGRIFFETHFAPLLRMQGFFNEVAFELATRDGARLPVLVNATERRGDDGQPLFTRITIFNATERRLYERELVEAKARGDAAHQQLSELHAVMQNSLVDEQATSALREQFIAVLGHDLRNPLGSLQGCMELLRRTPLNEKAQAVVSMAERSASRMAGLIEDVMDFARGRLGGGLALDRNANDNLESVLRHIVAELQISAPDRAIESHFSMTELVHCDARRIGQLASNLLANAITHGGTESPIRLSASTDAGWFELFIANGGEPIPPAVMERIFQPFSRGAIRPSMQGLGLGLYIAHAIAESHGGTLAVTSTAAETRFTFRMPIVEC